MCIVIDTNTFCSVFNSDSNQHINFKPVKCWILNGKGFLVYGGTKYKEEILKIRKFWPLLSELKRKSKLVEIDSDIVDKECEYVKQQNTDRAFNDQHIVAIFRASKCRLFCSCDKKSDKYIKDKSLYCSKQKPPSIYRSVQHKRLLCESNIIEIRNRI